MAKQCPTFGSIWTNSCSVAAFGSAVLMLSGLVYGQAPTITANADKVTGNPGDKITLTWKFEDPGNNVTQTKVRFDGEQVYWKSPHTWTAIPGTHVLHLESRRERASNQVPYILRRAAGEFLPAAMRKHAPNA